MTNGIDSTKCLELMIRYSTQELFLKLIVECGEVKFNKMRYNIYDCRFYC